MRILTATLHRLAVAAMAGLVSPFVCGCATFAVKMSSWESRSIERVTDAYVQRHKLGIVYLKTGGPRHPRIVWCGLGQFRGSGREIWSSLPTGGRRDATAPAQPPEGAERLPVRRLAEGETPSLPPGASVAVFERPKPRCLIVVLLADRGGANGEQVVYLRPGLHRPSRYKAWLALAVVFDVVTLPIQAVVFGTLECVREISGG